MVYPDTLTARIKNIPLNTRSGRSRYGYSFTGWKQDRVGRTYTFIHTHSGFDSFAGLGVYLIQGDRGHYFDIEWLAYGGSDKISRVGTVSDNPKQMRLF
jgi:hypothetical protein